MNFSSLRASLPKLILPLIGLVIVVALLPTVSDWLSYRNVTFNVGEGVKSVQITDPQLESVSDPHVYATLKSTGKVRLKPGSYVAMPTGDNIATLPMSFTVKGNTKTIDIKPYFGVEYLRNTFASEIPAVHKVITEKYSSLMESYDIRDDTFHHYGNWYTALLVQKQPAPRWAKDAYSVIARKENGSWRVVTTPQLVYAYKNHKDVPADIILAANQAASNFIQ